MGLNLVSSIQSIQVILHQELGVHVNIVLVLLMLPDFQCASAVDATFEQFHEWDANLGNVRSEDVDEQSEAESLSNLPKPIGSKIIEFTIEEGQETQKQFILFSFLQIVTIHHDLLFREIEVDDKYDHGDVNKLQNSQLLELSHRFIIHCVTLFQPHCKREYGRGYDVDNYDNEGGADDGRLLEPIVKEPLLTILGRIWFHLSRRLIQFQKLSEGDVDHVGANLCQLF